MIPMSRRRFLELAAGTTAIGLAGCSGPEAQTRYADWIPASDDGILTAYFDLTLAEKTSSIDPIVPLILPPSDASEPAEFVPDLSGLEDIEDPLLQFPLEIAGQIIGISSISLTFAGLGELLDPANPARGIAEVFVVNDTVVGNGDIDVSEADDALTSGTASAFGELRFDVVEQDSAFTYYERTGEESGAIALRDTAVVVGDTLADVHRVVDTNRGDHERAVTEDDLFSWLYETAGNGDLAVGWVGPIQLEEFFWGNQEPTLPTDLVTQTDSIASSVAFAPDSAEITAKFALEREDLDSVTRTRLKQTFGTASQQTTVTTGEHRFATTGHYSGDALDVEFVQPTDTPTPTSVPRGGDIPPTVANAVPPNAFEFVHKPDRNRVRVNFVEEFEAETVTVRATERGFETSTDTPGPVTYLTVAVDPAGDEVVVIVTVDGKSGVVASEQIPAVTSTAE